MKKKMALLLCIICVLYLTACSDNSHDAIEITNKDTELISNLNLTLPDGYYYSECKGFKINDSTIAITIYFSNEDINTEGGDIWAII